MWNIIFLAVYTNAEIEAQESAQLRHRKACPRTQLGDGRAQLSAQATVLMQPPPQMEGSRVEKEGEKEGALVGSVQGQRYPENTRHGMTEVQYRGEGTSTSGSIST